MSAFRSLIAAFSYFSILPVPSSPLAPQGATIGWLPLVGLCIGAASGLLANVVATSLHAAPWSWIVAFAGSIVLSGAIHLDGFLDASDALFATVGADRRLEILRDPRHGSYAIVAAALLVPTWLAALAYVEPARLPLVLSFAAVVSRAGAAMIAGEYPHARTGVQYTRCVLYGALWYAAIAIVLAFAREYTLLFVALAALVIVHVLAFVAAKRLGGGLTGDIYGWIIVLVDVGTLATVGALPR